MTLRSQYFYFGVLALGFLVVSFSCHYSKPIEFDASESKQPDKSVIYPWTGDPDCQHFPVQVIYSFQFYNIEPGKCLSLDLFIEK